MMLLIDSAVKVTLVMLVALSGVLAFRRRAAATRHWVLAVGMACAITMPLLAFVVPEWTISLSSEVPREGAVSSVTTTIITQNAPERIPPDAAARSGAAPAPIVMTASRLVVMIWLAGVVTMASLLVVGLTRLKRTAEGARPLESGPWVRHAAEIGRAAGVRRPILLLQSEHPTLLVTWGWRRPKVILPAAARQWTGDRARVVLCHELAHIRRGDWMAQMLGELLRAVYWFNPLVWIACRRLRRESEQACDDAVLRTGIDATDYASHLLDLARMLNIGRRPHVPAPAMARPSSLEGRISAMLNARLDRRPPTRAVQIATAAAFLVATLSIAGATQARFSTLSGTVVDQTDGFLPGTTLVLTNAASQARHEVETDRTGHFEFVGLPPGEYTLQVSQPGFEHLTEPIAITGRDLSKAIQLQVGSLQETITLVSGPAEAAKPDPERAQKLQALRDKWQERQQRATERCAGTAAAAGGGMGGNILQPMKLKDVKPIYPESASTARVGGVVTMEALIGTDGTVRDVRVIASPHPDIDRAAAEAVRQWEFTPTILNCTPIEVRMKIAANFVVRQ